MSAGRGRASTLDFVLLFLLYLCIGNDVHVDLFINVVSVASVAS